MNAPYKHDLWLYREDGEEIHLGYKEDADIARLNNVELSDGSIAVIQSLWQDLDIDNIKELHENVKRVVNEYPEDDYRIVYQDGYDYYSIEDLENMLS